MEHSYDVYINGVRTAGVDASNHAHAIQETLHYARQYADDGVITIKSRGKKVSIHDLMEELKSLNLA